MRDRPTADLIVLALTGLVAVILTLTVLSLLVSEIWYPDRDLGMLADRIAAIVSSLIAAIVGYLAGRGVNGTPSSE
jgi:hypothetical protein